MCKTPQFQNIFGSCDAQKLHNVVTRSTFGSQNGKNASWPEHFWTLSSSKSVRGYGVKLHAADFKVKTVKAPNVSKCSDHFWKLRCPKSACCCGVKHVSKSKCEKHSKFGQLLDVQPHHTTLQLQLQHQHQQLQLQLRPALVLCPQLFWDDCQEPHFCRPLPYVVAVHFAKML